MENDRPQGSRNKEAPEGQHSAGSLGEAFGWKVRYVWGGWQALSGWRSHRLDAEACAGQLSLGLAGVKTQKATRVWAGEE